MQEIEWIMSAGGPLICMEKPLVGEWGGIDPTMGTAPHPESDYDRACRATKYLETIALRSGIALIVGEEPFDTAFWQSTDGKLYLVRISYCLPDFDVDAVMQSLSLPVFDKPIEVLEFSIGSPEMALFDSACPGLKAGEETVFKSIEPGEYKILTQSYNPDRSTSLILHRFDRRS